MWYPGATQVKKIKTKPFLKITLYSVPSPLLHIAAITPTQLPAAAASGPHDNPSGGRAPFCGVLALGPALPGRAGLAGDKPTGLAGDKSTCSGRSPAPLPGGGPGTPQPREPPLPGQGTTLSGRGPGGARPHGELRRSHSDPHTSDTGAAAAPRLGLRG